MKKILIFARDPGGANTVIPLVAVLKRKGYEVLVFGKDIALNKFRNNKIKCQKYPDRFDSYKEKGAEKFLKFINPDLVITGTSSDDLTERYIWKASEKLSISSFAILDQWANYGLRFSKFKVSQIDKYDKDKKHIFLPKKILVMDDLAKRGAELAGLPKEKLIVCGQPYFEKMIRFKANSKDKARLRAKYRIEKKDYVITYASEPIQRTYGEKSQVANYWGYNEVEIFKKLLLAIESQRSQKKRDIKLIIKLHPKENEKYFRKIIQKTKINKGLKIIIDKATDPWLLISISNLVCGMSSMFLIESLLMNKPTLSIQIGLKKETPFVLDKMKILPSILNEKDLQKEIQKAFLGKMKQKKFKIIKNPVERAAQLVKRELCQN